MYEIYQRLLDEKGLKNSDVSRATGISNMTLSDWKRGVSKPKSDKMKKIADFLGVSVEYLETGKYINFETPEFEKEHLELITLYSQLEKEQKEAVFNLLRSFCSK